MNEIKLMREWIDNPNRDFSQGYELYKKFKPNTKLDEYFLLNAKNPDGACKGMLLQKLVAIHGKICTNPAVFETIIAKQIVAQKPIGSNPTPPAKTKVGNADIKKQSSDQGFKVDLKNLPEEIKPFGKRIEEITPLIGGLHAKLKALKPEEESAAKQINEQLLALDTEKRNLWEKIDNFVKLPAPTNTEENNPVVPTKEELTKKLKLKRDSFNRIENNLVGYRKNKPKLVAPNEAKKLEIEKEIEALEKELRAK